MCSIGDKGAVTYHD
jgi:hypothetical protein